MSRRQHVTLTFSVQVSLPVGESQAAFIERVTQHLTQFFRVCVVKLTDKKVTYL